MRQVWGGRSFAAPAEERKLDGTQLALRMMTYPLEYVDVHAAKRHAPR